MQTDELGIVTALRQRRARFAELHPALRRHFQGKGPDVSNAKTTVIEVDCRTGVRSFDRTGPVLQIKIDPPAPKIQPPPVPDNWMSPEGKRALAMSERVDAMGPRVRVGDIIRAVAAASDTTEGELCGAGRGRRFSHPRHIAMLLVREFRPDLSLPKIGFLFGNRDHTSVMHGEHESRKRILVSGTHRHWYDSARASILAQNPPKEAN